MKSHLCLLVFIFTHKWLLPYPFVTAHNRGERGLGWRPRGPGPSGRAPGFLLGLDLLLLVTPVSQSPTHGASHRKSEVRGTRPVPPIFHSWRRAFGIEKLAEFHIWAGKVPFAMEVAPGCVSSRRHGNAAPQGRILWASWEGVCSAGSGHTEQEEGLSRSVFGDSVGVSAPKRCQLPRDPRALVDEERRGQQLSLWTRIARPWEMQVWLCHRAALAKFRTAPDLSEILATGWATSRVAVKRVLKGGSAPSPRSRDESLRPHTHSQGPIWSPTERDPMLGLLLRPRARTTAPGPKSHCGAMVPPGEASTDRSPARSQHPGSHWPRSKA